MDRGQWVLLWAVLFAASLTLWGVLIARLVRKARALRDQLRVMTRALD